VFGAVFGNGFEISGLDPDRRDPPLWSDVVDGTLGARSASRGHIPNHYILISDDGGDYSYYMDTSVTDSRGECPVIVLGPGAEGVVARDFDEFLFLMATGEKLS
jgi:hypothetical protein